MDAGAGEVMIRGSRLLLRALRPAEIDGWSQAGPVTEHEREWVMYRITRQQWQAR